MHSEYGNTAKTMNVRKAQSMKGGYGKNNPCKGVPMKPMKELTKASHGGSKKG